MTAVCTGACVFGKCPHGKCVKYSQKKGKAAKINIASNILHAIGSDNVISNKTGLGVAVDIGTTTVVAYLFDMAESVLLGIKSTLNPQISLGVDVISRINYCDNNESGTLDMQSAVISSLNDMILSLCAAAQKDVMDICEVVIAGNTTMQHLFCGISPVSMGRLPFEPQTLFGSTAAAKDLCLCAENASVYMTPCISSFVGGDITAAILASGMYSKDGYFLLMDLGTNGELVLGGKDSLISTSTAAGPAFEGSEIECGMAGVEGAVASIYAFNGSLEYSTIGDTAPKGMCGSGILDLAAFGVSAGLIEETGSIVSSDEAADAVNRFLRMIDGECSVFITDNVYLKQKDIRQLQTAKAAVAAGVDCLVSEAGITAEEISRVYIAGGFGNFMDKASAVAIGLLDGVFADRIECIGNAAGSGAVMMLLDDRYKKEAGGISSRTGHVELGGSAYFMERYVERMMF